MGRLNKEICLVGGDHVNQLYQLFGRFTLGKNQIGLLLKGIEVMSAETFAQSGLEHAAFVGRELDAALLIDQPAEPGKILVGQTGVETFHAGDGFLWKVSHE